MSFLIVVLMGLLGVALLYYGAEFLVRGAVQLALNLGLSPLVVGLTVVSFSTSMPEAVSSIFARIQGQGGDLALGNVMGSNVANVLLILGLSAVIRPLTAAGRLIWVEIPIMLSATVLVMGIMSLGPFTWGHGVFLVSCLGLYLYYQKQNGSESSEVHLEELGVEGVRRPFSLTQKEIGRDVAYILAGVIMLSLGGYFLIEGAVQVARQFGVSERVIGLSMVAVGTSLPELAVSVVAAMRKETDILLGNIVGSNLFNLLFVLGVVSMLGTLNFSKEVLFIDASVVLGSSVLLWLLVVTKKTLGRLDGFFFLTLYGAYFALLFGQGVL